MKPILLVIACIGVLMLAIHLNNRGAAQKSAQSALEKSTGTIVKDSYSFLSNEVRLYDLMY